MRFLIKNGNVVLNNNTIKKLDMLIENEKITQIDEKLSLKCSTIFDCSGLFLLPGLVDMHVHLREPGFCHKETIQTGCLAAAAGGFSAVCCMPNTKPAIDCEQIVDQIMQKTQNACAKVYIISAITKNLDGKNLVNFEKIAQNGAIAFSDDGKCLENETLMEQALQLANRNNKFIISHCEDSELTQDGLLNEGEISKTLQLKGISNISESKVVENHIQLAKKTGCKIHIAHVSTKESVAAIKEAKQQKVKVSAETCPHYFFLNDEELLTLNAANCKINPPIRSENDRKAIETAVMDGIIDCIVTDHAPHSELEKQNFLTAPNGAIGLETSLACTLTHFFHTKKLDLFEIINLMAKKPCEILGLNFEGIKPNAIANFSVVDLHKKWVVDPKKFKSKARNTPFEGKTLIGKVLKTFFRGRLVFDETSP